MNNQENEGWLFLENSPKWHYFRKGMSLCGRYMYISWRKVQYSHQEGNYSSNCKACYKKRQKEKEKQKESSEK